MNISDEVIKSGEITMYYGELDSQTIKDVREFNELMCDCRLKMKYLRIIEHGYKILNFLFICIMIYGAFLTVFRYPVPAVIILAAYAVLFVIFGLMKKNLRACTILTVMLVLLDLRFLILTAADIILMLMHKKIIDKLKTIKGYPEFKDIRINYEHRLRYDDNGNLLQMP